MEQKDLAGSVVHLLLKASESSSIEELCKAISEDLPALVPFEIGTLGWKPLELPQEEASSDTVDDELTEEISFNSKGHFLRSMEHFKGPIDNAAGRSAPSQIEGFDGILRLRTENGDPVMVKLRSCAVIPLHRKGSRVGLLTLYSTREEGLLEKEPAMMSDIWKYLGWRLHELLEKDVLLKETDRARELLDSSEDIIVTWVNKGSVWNVDCNSKAEEFAGRDGIMAEALEGPFFVPPGPDMDRARTAWERAYESSEKVHLGLALKGKDGAQRRFLSTFSPIMEGGESIGVRMTGIDMSRLDPAVSSLDMSNRIGYTLLSSIVHGLKDHLSVLKGYSELLRSGEPDRRDQYLIGMDRAVRRVEEAVWTVSAASKVGDGSLGRVFSRTDVSRLVRRCIDQMKDCYAGIEMVLEDRGGSFSTSCHPGLGSAVMELMEDQARRTPQGGKVIIDLSATLEGIVLSLRSEGGERSEPPLNHVEENTPKLPHLTNAILELHKGRLWYEVDDITGRSLKALIPWDPGQ